MEEDKNNDYNEGQEKNPFEVSIGERIKDAAKSESISGASNALFGSFTDKYSDNFSDLRENLDKSNLNILFRTYLSEMFFVPILVYISSLAAFGTAVWILELSFSLEIIIVTLYPVIIAIFSFILMYIYPTMLISEREENIERNLPFALSHMAAVSNSGVPPSSMFELLMNFEEYGEISKEAKKVVRRMNVFGEDLTTSLKQVAKSGPSEELKEIFYGMLSTIETGGNLDSFLQEQADSALFEYKMKMKREIENLSTYASFYTAILVAAPLFLIFILAILNMMGGSIMGLAIDDVIKLGVYVILPIVNTIFIFALALRRSEY